MNLLDYSGLQRVIQNIKNPYKKFTHKEITSGSITLEPSDFTNILSLEGDLVINLVEPTEDDYTFSTYDLFFYVNDDMSANLTFNSNPAVFFEMGLPSYYQGGKYYHIQIERFVFQGPVVKYNGQWRMFNF